MLAACGGGSDSDGAQPQAVTFVFRLHGLPAAEEFRASTASPDVIAAARAQLRLPVSARRLFATGAIRAGDASANPGWRWHLVQLELAEVTIELCDGRPSMVEADLGYWLGTVGRFCPWSSYVHAELPTIVQAQPQARHLQSPLAGR
ncbi:MAG: hypothetical protein JWP65_3936 [Ramlibacter sp.]|uniref:BP74-related protein n=1 Tax=Ramlibacter sp. TaxID=1917967 RepID=UPI002628BE1A|nr:hypothetical protein [Ramlibacter sp.]MDB5753515.1 hypothetical protein [Ramlibacter sp.]